MATTKISRKEMQQDEFIESVFDLGDWLELHWRRVAIGAGAALALFLIGYAWVSMRERSAVAANDLFSQGLLAFSPAAGAGGTPAAPRYAEALPLFEQAADKARGQPVGVVARLYRGRTLIALGRTPEATPILESVASSGNERLAAQAKLSMAEAASAAKDYERAASLLQDVATSMSGAFPPDGALMLLAGVREAQGKNGDAKRIYDDIVARYPQGAFAGDARTRITELAARR